MLKRKGDSIAKQTVQWILQGCRGQVTNKCWKKELEEKTE